LAKKRLIGTATSWGRFVSKGAASIQRKTFEGKSEDSVHLMIRPKNKIFQREGKDVRKSRPGGKGHRWPAPRKAKWGKRKKLLSPSKEKKKKKKKKPSPPSPEGADVTAKREIPAGIRGEIKRKPKEGLAIGYQRKKKVTPILLYRHKNPKMSTSICRVGGGTGYFGGSKNPGKKFNRSKHNPWCQTPAGKKKSDTLKGKAPTTAGVKKRGEEKRKLAALGEKGKKGKSGNSLGEEKKKKRKKCLLKDVPGWGGGGNSRAP